MGIEQAPAAIIILINLIICAFAFITPQVERVRVFQIVMGSALLSWSGGVALYNVLGSDSAIYILPAVAVMLIPANFLSFALTFPKPLPWVEKHKFPTVILYLPGLALISLTDYAKVPQSYISYAFKVTLIETHVWTGIPLSIVSGLYIGAAAFLYNRRLKESFDLNIRDFFRYVLYSFIGALAFGLAMIVMTQTSQGEFYPAPAMMLALVGELGLFWSIRYLQESTPESASRAIFLPLLALALVFVIILFKLVLEAVLEEQVFSDLQMSVLLFITVSASLVVVLARENLQESFDRFFFKRAHKYRQTMREMHSELRDARERLSRAQRMAIVGEVAASLAHEIKNPLGPIKGYTQMLMKDAEALPDQAARERFARALNIIGEEVDNINERVRRLLEFSRSQEIDRQDCRIEQIIQRAADLARAEILGKAEIEIAIRLPPELPTVSADPFRLHEAFFNVIQNAIQAMGERGKLAIELRRRDSSSGHAGLEIRFADSGPGIPAELAGEIFKPFYTTRSGGTGLGLGVVKNAIQAHRGEIVLENRPNEGAIVSIWLPVDGEGAKTTTDAV